MAFGCPDKNNQNWINLETSVGKTLALVLWNHYKGIVPAKYFNRHKLIEVNSEVVKETTTTEGTDINNQTTQTNPLVEAGVKPTISITTTNYTKNTPLENPNTGFIFTENSEMLGTNKNVNQTQAIIRTDKAGNINPNALPIVTKKLQVAGEKGQWKDTEEDFNEFKKVNTQLINNIKNSQFTELVFPPGFATDKANLPTRFAEWLQKELLDNFGLVTEFNETKSGLISKEIKNITVNNQPTTDILVEDSFEENNPINNSVIIPENSSPNNHIIFEKDGVQYLMNDQQQKAFDVLKTNITERLRDRERITNDSFQDTQEFTTPLTSKYSGIIPTALYKNMFGLQGFGGTGKTTLTKKLLAELQGSGYSPRVINFAAPTHPAVTQLQEALGFDSEGTSNVDTLATLLRIRVHSSPSQNEKVSTGKSTFQPIDAESYSKTYAYRPPVGSSDIIIIDESSMVGVETISVLIDRLNTDFKKGKIAHFPIILFLGDYHQLPPITGKKGNELGIISSTVLHNSEKSPRLTQVMRSNDKPLADLFISIANEIDNYIDALNRGETYTMSPEAFYQELEKTSQSILKITKTNSSVDLLINDYVNYLSTNNYPDGMFWIHYNKADNVKSTVPMSNKIRETYLKRIGSNPNESLALGDYIIYNGDLGINTGSLNIPLSLIPNKEEILKLKTQENIVNGNIMTIGRGHIKPKSRYKIISKFDNTKITKEQLFLFYSSQNNEISIFRTALTDILQESLENPEGIAINGSIIYNRQKKMRAFFKFADVKLQGVDLVQGLTKNNVPYKRGLKYNFINTVTNKTTSVEIPFRNNLNDQFQESILPYFDYLNGRSKELFIPSYIGSSHSYQGAGITNVIGDSVNILSYLNMPGMSLDIMASLYTTMTRTKNKLAVLTHLSNLDNSAWRGFTTDTGSNTEVETSKPIINNLPTLEYNNQTLSIQDNRILNEQGEEVYKENNADRLKILAKYRVLNNEAVIIPITHNFLNPTTKERTQEKIQYIVNTKGTIISAKTGQIITDQLKPETIQRILKTAEDKFKDKNITYNFSQEEDINLTGDFKTIKLGVEELFDENPELANIGTQEQYSQYLSNFITTNFDNIISDLQSKNILEKKCS